VDDEKSGAEMHQARVVRSGSDLTLIGHGAMVSVLHQAADIAQSEGISLEIIDLRSLSPIDYDTIVHSVEKTTRAVVVQEAPGNVSVGSEIAATLAERAFYVMEAHVKRVTGFDTPFPPAKLEGIYLPDADRILDAVDRSLAY
jgi:pyruvate dehydrogenase E1 component beta subunit